ncbi:hypothetical protein GCM10009735_43570 [Actinomadura chokoriensis]
MAVRTLRQMRRIRDESDIIRGRSGLVPRNDRADGPTRGDSFPRAGLTSIPLGHTVHFAPRGAGRLPAAGPRGNHLTNQPMRLRRVRCAVRWHRKGSVLTIGPDLMK